MSAQIEIAGVSKAFGGVVANHEITLDVPEGHITGLIGPNGSGKTTLFNSIVGYHPIDSGSIKFEGQEISKLRVQHIARLGLLRTFQQTRIYGKMNCVNNMLISVPHRNETFGTMFTKHPPEVTERAEDLLEFVGLYQKRFLISGELSFGQQKLLEFAMALTILVGAGVLTDFFQRSLAMDLGFDADNLLTMQVSLPEHKYAEDDAMRSFVTELNRELNSLPGAPPFAIMSVLPRTRRLPFTEFTIDGRHVEPGEEPSTSWLSVSPDYFATMDIALQRGRRLTEVDREGSAPVVLVNQRMVIHFFGGEDPVGRRVTVFGESREIVGVVANIAQRRLSGLQALNAAIYFPMAQRPLRGLWIVLRAAGDPHALAGATQTAVWAVDADQPVSAIQTMNEHMSSTLAGPNLLTQILFVVGGLALGLAAIGIYGVMAYSVSQQTNEIGIRMALGAKPGQILTGVTRQGIKLAALGLVLGAPAAALVVVFISRIFQTGDISDVGGIAATPIVLVSATLATVALVACILPAR
ncbi:MAG: ATP-binding cassette domain-containing protein, partial [Acidobacteria bacterium]|nr:ATP-binding cassette domain-containing protein [Acidobacteriota bacterium]